MYTYVQDTYDIRTHSYTFVHIRTHTYTQGGSNGENFTPKCLSQFRQSRSCVHICSYVYVCVRMCTYLYVCVRMCTYVYVLGTKMHFWTDGVQSADFTEQLDGVLQAASTHRQSSSSMPTARGYTVRSTLERCMRLHRSRQDQTCHQCLCFSAAMQRWSPSRWGGIQS